MNDSVRPVALVILDGWGEAPAGPGNAVDLANTPTFDGLRATYPTTLIRASGVDVGLPAGQIGNSEVGHLNLGAGRVVFQDLTRIDRAVEDGSFVHQTAFAEAFARVKSVSSTLHIVGLCSHGGVHASIDHIKALIRGAVAAGVGRIRIHAITDGRDVLPDASLTDIPRLEAELQTGQSADVQIASVIGRYWAMDRDHRWERTEKAFDLLVHGRSEHASVWPKDAVREAHESGTTDEFIVPTAIRGIEHATLRDGDAVIFANFRPDRMRQLVASLLPAPFEHFTRTRVPEVHMVCMTEYDPTFRLSVAFPPHNVTRPLADLLEAAGVGQLHVAETEKYAHVTYFFNGGDEREHAAEVRALVPSPRDVATYDLKPEMSAEGVADAFCEGFADPQVGFGIVNFANPDMVGHTGSLAAAITACEHVDTQLQRVLDAVTARGGVCIVTADHGNAECMIAEDGGPHTAHTTNPVPVVITDSSIAGLRPGGRLADVAPTILQLMGLEQPDQMDGVSLVVE